VARGKSAYGNCGIIQEVVGQNPYPIITNYCYIVDFRLKGEETSLMVGYTSLPFTKTQAS